MTSDNRTWELKYYDMNLDSRKSRWIMIQIITPETPFLEIMESVNKLKRQKLNLRIFEKGGSRKFNYNIFMADTRTASEAAKDDKN